MEYIDVLVAPDSPEIDVIFVHGLNPKGQENHARKTWTHSGDASHAATFWPQALLPESVPSARILLFAYNSSILNNASNAPVHGHANTLLNRLYNKRREENEKHRPIVFIAHSLGGLLVKQALVEAKINPLYTCIKASTYGLVFFATPHSGGNGAGVAESAAKFCSALTGQPKNSLLETLEKASLLNEISKDHFRPQIGDYEVLTFMETHKMDVKLRRRRFFPQITSMYIVDSGSAKLGAPRETALGLDRNHSEICKFLSKDDRAYQGVEPNLRAMAENSRGHSVQCDHMTTPQRLQSNAVPHISSVPGAPPSFIGLPNQEHHVNLLRRCDPFVGREALTQDICKTWTEWSDSSPRRISLSGLGSVGKTQLSRSVIDHLGPRQIILWLRASSAKILREDLLSAALDLKSELLRFESREIPLPEQRIGETEGLVYSSGTRLNYLLDLLKVWLRTAQAHQSKVLVVLDDLDGLEPSELPELSELISGDHIEVIYSTRDPMMADQTSYMYAANFNVPPLEPSDAQGLFKQLRNPHPALAHLRGPGIVDSSSSPDTENISKLVAKVGHLPAGIVNATHYFKDNFASANPYALSAFLAKWEGTEAVKDGLLQFRRRTFIYPHTMQASFEVSLSRLKRNIGSVNARLYTCSLCLLHLLSMMDVSEFARTEMEFLCALLEKFLDSEKVEYTFLRYLSGESVAHRCITELIHVSLLSDSVDRDILLLNNLTKACVRLTMKWDMGETAQLKQVLQRAAKYISRTWLGQLKTSPITPLNPALYGYTAETKFDALVDLFDFQSSQIKGFQVL